MIEREPVFERDRFFATMLRPLAIEKTRPFAPDERQQRILEEAVFVGEAMAKANDFSKRFESADHLSSLRVRAPRRAPLGPADIRRSRQRRWRWLAGRAAR